jgi:hypothetical protein
VQAAELFADGGAIDELRAAIKEQSNSKAPGSYEVRWLLRGVAGGGDHRALEVADLWLRWMRPDEQQTERAHQAALVRDIFGNPFRPAPALDPAWLIWQGGTVARLARAVYDERRLTEGTLDPMRLSLLADALEDAGCADAELLGHLRGPGPHVRGCWALDLVLGKS